MTHKYFLCISIILCLVATCITVSSAYGQCDNADFEQGSFANWQGRTGSCCGINTPTNGIVAGRHTIMTGPGTDANTCNTVTVVAPGSTFSARVGNAGSGSQAERLLYTFTVTAQNALIIYKYAVVLENPSAHSVSEQPRFEVQVRDANGNPIPCTYYQVAASSNLPSFQNCGGVVYKDWTTVGVDVSGYIGQTVTLDFATGDCDLGAHFGYAYVDASCAPLQIDSRYCLGNNQAQLSAPVGFASYQWSTGESTPTIVINNPGNGQQVSCTITSVTGCVATLNAVLNPTNPNPAFTLSNNCMGDATFTNTSTVVNGTVGGYIWNFGDGTPADTNANPIHVYTNPGQYNVDLIVISDIGCADTLTQSVNIFPTPLAAFNYNDACLGNAVTLTDQSTLQQGTINQWSWDLGNGLPPVLSQNGVYTYPDTGSYNVTLIVSQSGQCPDTITQVVNVKANPLAGFITADICNGLQSVFTDQSTTYWGNVSYGWDFGDNAGTSTLPSPTYTYTTPGAYTASLIITQTDGTHTCADTAFVPINIYAVPVAAFGTDAYQCLGEETNYSNQSSISSGEPLVFSWDLGNSTISIDPSPAVTYSTYGTYTVTLIATSSKGCADTIQQQQYIYAIPTAGIVPDVTSGCEPLSVNYAGQGSVAQGNVTGYAWDFGNTSTSTQQNPATLYLNAGTYNVTLVVAAGDVNQTCYDTAQTTIDVHPLPIADFVTTDNCYTVNTVFNNQSTVASGTIQTYEWDFGDNIGTSNLQNPNYLFGAEGVYNVDLIVTTDHNCKDTVTLPIEIFPLPNVAFGADTAAACTPVTVNFSDASNVGNGTIVSWLWDFGDGFTSTDPNPIHGYDNTGVYTVTLQVTTNHGCTDEFVNVNFITAYPNPIAQFTASPTVTDEFSSQLGLDIVNFSQGATVYNWNLGNDILSDEVTPRITYDSAGTYIITLYVENQFGCSDQITQEVLVNPVYTFYVPNAFTPNGDGTNDLFFGTGTNIIAYEMNIFNRWGERIFDSFDMNNKWDGRLKDQRVQDEVYIYVFHVTDIFGGQHVHRGSVTLIK